MPSNITLAAMAAVAALATACAIPNDIVYSTGSDKDIDELVPLVASAARSMGYQVSKEDDVLGTFFAVRPDAVPMLVRIEHPLPIYRYQLGCPNNCYTNVEVTPVRVDGDRVAAIDLGSAPDSVEEAARTLAAGLGHAAR